MATSLHTPVPAVPATRVEPGGVRWDRVVLGLIIVALGAGWLLDGLDVPVPWRLFPAAGLVVVGAALVLARGHRGGLVGLGVLLTVAALLSAMSAGRFVGPVGDRTVGPVVAAWPVDSSLSAGTLTVDLTRSVLPVDEQVRVAVGVGEIRLNVPAGAQVRVAAEVGLGDIRVDGQTVDNGLDPQWSTESVTDGALLVDARVGLGAIEVSHE